MAIGVQKLNEAYKTQIVPSTKKLKDGASQLASGLGAAKEGATKLNDASTKLNDGSKRITEGSTQLAAGSAPMKKGMSEITAGSAQVAGGVDVLLNNSKTSQVALQQAVDTKLKAYLKDNPKAMEDANMQSFVSTLNSLNKTATDEKNVAMMKELQTGAHTVAEGSKQLEDGSTSFINGSQKFAQSTVTFAKGAEQFSEGAGSFAQKTGRAVVAATQISGGLDKLYVAMNGDFKNGLSQISDKVPALTQGVAKLASGSGTLSGGLAQLSQKNASASRWNIKIK